MKFSADFANLLMQTWQEADEDITDNQLKGLWMDNIEDTLHDFGVNGEITTKELEAVLRMGTERKNP